MTTTPPAFSVVIPAYNAAGFLGQAIASVMDCAPLREFEIVVVDDGSSDQTSAVAEAFGPPVRCIRQRNTGVAGARAAGVAAARADIVALLDADDRALPGRFARQVAYLLDNPHVDVCFGNVVEQADPGGDYLARMGLPVGHEGFAELQRPLAQLLALGNFIPTSAACVRRSAFLAAESQRATRSMAEDHYAWCRIAARGGAFAYTSEPLAWYRQEQHGNLMGTPYRYTGEVETVAAILREHGGTLDAEALASARVRFFKGCRRLLFFAWACEGRGPLLRRLDLLRPLLPRHVAMAWALTAYVPGGLPRAAWRLRRRARQVHGTWASRLAPRRFWAAPRPR